VEDRKKHLISLLSHATMPFPQKRDIAIEINTHKIQVTHSSLSTIFWTTLKIPIKYNKIKK
jgi:hypothetical protein